MATHALSQGPIVQRRKEKMGGWFVVGAGCVDSVKTTGKVIKQLFTNIFEGRLFGGGCSIASEIVFNFSFVYL